MALGPSPGTDPLRDFGRFIGAMWNTLRGQPPVPAPPQPARRAAPQAAPSEGVRAADELVVFGLPPAARAQLEAAGFRVIAVRSPAGPATLARLRAPPGMTPEAALAAVRARVPGATVDRNHLYRASTGSRAPGQPLQQIAWPASGCGQAPRLGMVDTAIDRNHPALAAAAVTQETVRGPGLSPAGRAHGTAVAVLLVGQGQGAARGLLPQAQLIAVDAFHRRQDGDAADAFDLASALLLLGERRVAVANLSVAGPANQVLDQAGRQATRGGMLAVAAAGNDGAGQRRYPAAYPWAIAATAVDAQGGAYARASQGSHIAFAAPGVGVPVATAQGGRVLRTGTSFAAPFVTAALAVAYAPGGPPTEAIRRVADSARDLGAPGRDPVFGWGLVQAASLCAPAAPAVSADLPG
jgi:hypothetical protein